MSTFLIAEARARADWLERHSQLGARGRGDANCLREMAAALEAHHDLAYLSDLVIEEWGRLHENACPVCTWVTVAKEAQST